MQHVRWLGGLCSILALLAGCARPDASPAAATSALTVPVGQTIEITSELTVRHVREGVHVATHAFPWPGNSLLVEMANGARVLIDTPYTPEATQALLEWAAERLGARPVTAINTGFHYDNLGGNAYLVEQGIEVYGSSQTAALLAERGDAVRALTLEWLSAPEYESYRQAHRDLPYVPPTHLFELEEGLELAFGEEAVQVYYPGPSHAPDNVVVYLPSRRVLFGGCMIVGGDQVGNIADADLAAWPVSVGRLTRFDADLVVPGHGDRLDADLIQHTIDLLVALQ